MITNIIEIDYNQLFVRQNGCLKLFVSIQNGKLAVKVN